MNTLIKGLMVGLMAVTISACHHENPLKTQTAKASITFLINASANAEKRLHFAIHNDAYGFTYLECMEGKQSPEIHCDALYQGMIAFAKEGHYAGFQTVTQADLTDQKVFESLADEYAETAATIWPHFVSGS
ncbi:protein LvrD [Legionella pneumophila serogroup 1]|uniref:T4SS-associated protein LvrD n=1 Tax=Legionella pneumophila TaxID=446 RepID=UPI001A1FAC99|nr:T4SS-associated protein LvrD [Legionella pneumophila]HAT9741603.1 protein LvrD [Legionella pneumophila subsp. pneumophila]MCH9059802.1 protein LvrD [Legionella pneumophila serogroup 1]MCH9071810.1 protein LvrD [Legionella pneumophila serogroup 1]MCH9077840.1 protein LvrD [Legionella pneumophila serogroup 1]MCH9080764.1 protein LvrD [Legionella pneumophila serogroup 1]